MSSLTTQIWENHFGGTAAVPFGRNTIAFFSELSDKIEEAECREISGKAALGLVSAADLARLTAMMEDYRIRNGRELEMATPK